MKNTKRERSEFPDTIFGTENYYKANNEYSKYMAGTCHEEIIQQFKHLFNFFDLFGERRMRSYEDSLVEKGVLLELVLKLKDRGMRQSNWMKNSFIETRARLEGVPHIKVKW